MYARIDLDGGDDYSRSTMCLVRSYILWFARLQDILLGESCSWSECDWLFI